MRFSAILTARLTPEMAERICACAEQIGVSEGAVVRWAVGDFMRRLDLDASLSPILPHSKTPTLPYSHTPNPECPTMARGMCHGSQGTPPHSPTPHPGSPEPQLIFEPPSESDHPTPVPSPDAQPDQTIAADSGSAGRVPSFDLQALASDFHPPSSIPEL